MEEKKKSKKPKISMGKDYSHADILSLKKECLDPNFHYRFLRDDTKNINLKTKFLGYEIDKEYNKKLRNEDKESTYQVGDLVLGKIPKEIYEARQKAKVEKIVEREKSLENPKGLSPDIEIEKVLGEKKIE